MCAESQDSTAGWVYPKVGHQQMIGQRGHCLCPLGPTCLINPCALIGGELLAQREAMAARSHEVSGNVQVDVSSMRKCVYKQTWCMV